MLALHAQIPRIAAERRLDAATAAHYPDWKPQARERWWKDQVRLISGPAPRRRRGRRQPSVPDGIPLRRTSLFFVDGQPVGIGPLRQQLGAKLGGGFS